MLGRGSPLGRESWGPEHPENVLEEALVLGVCVPLAPLILHPRKKSRTGRGLENAAKAPTQDRGTLPRSEGCVITVRPAPLGCCRILWSSDLRRTRE